MDIYCQSHDQTESPPAFVFGKPITYNVGGNLTQAIYGTCPKCGHIISVVITNEDVEQEIDLQKE